MIYFWFKEQPVVKKTALLFIMIFIISMNNQSFTAEISGNNDQQNALETDEHSTTVIDATVINSPLVSENEEHGQLHLSTYDPQHKVYPVKMISIDDWLLPGADYGKPLLLAAGEHRIRLVPDFSNISPQKLFMNYFWPEKHVIFFLRKSRIWW